MSLTKLDLTQLAAERAYYEAVLAAPHNDNVDRLVAQVRLKEIETEQNRRCLHPTGGDRTVVGDRWTEISIIDLIRQTGCRIGDVGNGRFKGDHGNRHGSKSGLCLVVWGNDGRWWCSSCRQGGDAAAWIADNEGITYREAANKLRQRLGLPSRYLRREVVVHVV